jgi:hypothetical protein
LLALLGNVEIFVCGRGRRGVGLALFAGRTSLAFAPVVALTVATLAVATVILTVTDILHLAVTIDGAPGPVAVAAVIVALTAVVLARRATTVTARGGAAAARRSVTTRWDTTVVARAAVATVAAALTTGAVTAGIEAP